MKSVMRVVLTAAIAASVFTHVACAQDAAAQQSAQQAATAAAPPAVLSNISPQIGNLNPFPPPDPKNFTASFPTVETVKSFLQQTWGYDADRLYEVEAILKTPVDSISQVVVYVAERGQPADQTKVFPFLVLNDGKHAISGDTIMDFGATPFAGKRALLQARADGPAHGAASKDLELVEFADMQCPHCKEAQSKMDQLAQDYPTAHIVFQNFPIKAIHPSAYQAAAYGLCVSQLKPDAGNAAFLTYVQAVFDTQDALTPDPASPNTPTDTLNNAVVKAGLDATKVAACSTTKAITDDLDASLQLAKDVQVDSVPTLMINGRPIPLGGVTYDVLKTIINYQAQLDGVTLPPQPAPAAVNLTAPPTN
jgi:protein-disulfide isomerase